MVVVVVCVTCALCIDVYLRSTSIRTAFHRSSFLRLRLFLSFFF